MALFNILLQNNPHRRPNRTQNSLTEQHNRGQYSSTRQRAVQHNMLESNTDWRGFPGGRWGHNSAQQRPRGPLYCALHCALPWTQNTVHSAQQRSRRPSGVGALSPVYSVNCILLYCHMAQPCSPLLHYCTFSRNSRSRG